MFVVFIWNNCVGILLAQCHLPGLLGHLQDNIPGPVQHPQDQDFKNKISRTGIGVGET